MDGWRDEGVDGKEGWRVREMMENDGDDDGDDDGGE